MDGSIMGRQNNKTLSQANCGKNGNLSHEAAHGRGALVTFGLIQK